MVDTEGTTARPPRPSDVRILGAGNPSCWMSPSWRRMRTRHKGISILLTIRKSLLFSFMQGLPSFYGEHLKARSVSYLLDECTAQLIARYRSSHAFLEAKPITM